MLLNEHCFCPVTTGSDYFRLRNDAGEHPLLSAKIR